MNTLYIENDKLCYEGKSFFITDLYTEQTYQSAYDLAGSYENCIFINELFMNYALAYLAMEQFINANAIAQVVVRNKQQNDFLVWIAEDLARKKQNGLEILWECKKKSFTQSGIYYYTMVVASAAKLTLEFVSHRGKPVALGDKEKIAVVRSKASISKIGKLEDVFMLYERIGSGPSVYDQFPLRRKLKWVTRALLHHKKESRKCLDVAEALFGPSVAKHCRGYYSKRIVHTAVYAQMIREFLESIRGKVFVTGNNLDRYAIVEENAARSCGVSVICVPHGLEYGFKLPHCFTGDIFYANSEYASRWLNELYGTDKFVFDPVLTGKLFTVKTKASENGTRVVFLTEPGELYINYEIIEALHAFLAPRNMELWLKLHPKDLKSNYAQYPFVHFEDDYNKAICDNICVSRKSTALLEAVYNGSDSCAIILIGKDKFEFDNFPSLKHERIRAFESLQALCDRIGTLL